MVNEKENGIIRRILNKKGIKAHQLGQADGIMVMFARECIKEAKKEVFDDIDKLKLNYQGSHKMIDEEDYQELKQRHLSPSAEESYNTHKTKGKISIN